MKHRRANHSRTLSPKFGLMGFLGFLGFVGIGTYQADRTVFPFSFFTFFGFFGFFFEGKMSGTLMDERYLQNRERAEAKAFRAGSAASFLILIASTWDWLFAANEAKLLFITIALSLVFAVTIIANEYLLYRYDHDELGEEE